MKDRLSYLDKDWREIATGKIIKIREQVRMLDFVANYVLKEFPDIEITDADIAIFFELLESMNSQLIRDIFPSKAAMELLSECQMLSWNCRQQIDSLDHSFYTVHLEWEPTDLWPWATKLLGAWNKYKEASVASAREWILRSVSEAIEVPTPTIEYAKEGMKRLDKEASLLTYLDIVAVTYGLPDYMHEWLSGLLKHMRTKAMEGSLNIEQAWDSYIYWASKNDERRTFLDTFMLHPNPKDKNAQKFTTYGDGSKPALTQLGKEIIEWFVGDDTDRF